MGDVKSLVKPPQQLVEGLEHGMWENAEHLL